MLATRWNTPRAATCAAQLVSPFRGQQRCAFRASELALAAVKTKKSYADLPNTHLRPDGTPAPPLDEWWSGDVRRAGELRKRDTGIVNALVEEAKRERRRGEGADEPPPRKRRKKVHGGSAPPYETQPPEFPFPEEEEIEDVPKTARSRKKKVDADEAEPASLKKSRKKKATSEEVSEISPKQSKVATDAEERKGGLPREILDNLSRFPHCILLTRVGKFYESYFDQSHEVARLLNIKLAYRKWDGRSIPFCGFPLQYIDKYLKVLVQQNRRFVALCEEYPRWSKPGVMTFDRRVARVVTPGTLIDESFLNQYENNYLLAISHQPEADQQKIGLAWIDVSTGEFYSKSATLDILRDELARIGPREIVLDKAFETARPSQLEQALAEELNGVSYTTPMADEGENALDFVVDPPENEQETLEKTVSTTPVDDITEDSDELPSLAEFSAEERGAITLLTTYLHANLLDHMPTLSMPAREGAAARMQIDSHTIKALEIRESIREGGVKGSLLSVVKRTSTSSGTRLLARWLCSPSTSIPEINARQALVAFFHARDHFRADLVAALASTEDTGRIVQRFLLGRGEANDLHALNSTIRVWSALKARILQERQQESLEATERGVEFAHEKWTSLDALVARMSDLQDLSNRIGAAIKQRDSVKEAPIVDSDDSDTEVQVEGTLPRVGWKAVVNWTIRPQFSEKIMSLHKVLEELLNQREQLEADLQLQYDAPSLTLRSSPAQGNHVHLLKAKRDRKRMDGESEFVGIAESGTTKSYFYQVHLMAGSESWHTIDSLSALGTNGCTDLRNNERIDDGRKRGVNSHAPQLRRTARILDELDVTLGFANLAKEMNFVRPVLTEEPVYEVVDGRHPTVELGLLTNGRVFIPNSLRMNPTSQLHIITGPNMAGKSTLLRQTALIAVLAQTGSFVPAESATIGIVDKLFSRVGAKDDLFHDRSTFMVEMLETAEILQRATARSLVIMDEVGRGTTVKDGLAIAFATVHHLLSVNGCRALFATHFHEIADMLGYSTDTAARGLFDNVGFFCTDVDETNDGHFAYSYRIRSGVNRDSHGLKVAQLAGMPQSAVTVAQDALTWLKTRKEDSSSNAAELNSLGRSITNRSP
ncbi:DNA mismatch repair protein [Favolaschia claudopus]|uniref:DNA mismatch repair protein n=1 Tax=Favolaschia claudopus TaxID=2862362 RepID=A0AAW0EG78_9AGAR